MNTDKILHQETTEKIIKGFYTVYNTLGHGFLEKVYENAFVIELIKSGLHVEQQKKIEVFYDEQIVGEYYADILVNDLVILELKAVDAIAPEHEAQIIN